MNKYENITEIAKMICGFIFSHSGEEPDGVSELILGVSATYVSVRHLGPGLRTEMLEQDLPALFNLIKTMKGNDLSVVSFKDGYAFLYEYGPGRQSRSEREETAPEGALFRVNTTGGEDKFILDRESFCEALSEVLSANVSSPDPEKVTVFLNGSALEIKRAAETSL